LLAPEDLGKSLDLWWFFKNLQNQTHMFCEHQRLGEHFLLWPNWWWFFKNLSLSIKLVRETQTNEEEEFENGIFWVPLCKKAPEQ
jgi:hypothetical protein